MRARRKYRLISIVVAAATLTVSMLTFSPDACAHAFLAGASPPAGSVLPTAPAELTLRFTEPVEPSFCAVELRDAAGAPMPTGALRLAPRSTKVLVVPLPRLQP